MQRQFTAPPAPPRPRASIVVSLALLAPSPPPIRGMCVCLYAGQLLAPGSWMDPLQPPEVPACLLNLGAASAWARLVLVCTKVLVSVPSTSCVGWFPPLQQHPASAIWPRASRRQVRGIHCRHTQCCHTRQDYIECAGAGCCCSRGRCSERQVKRRGSSTHPVADGTARGGSNLSRGQPAYAARTVQAKSISSGTVLVLVLGYGDVAPAPGWHSSPGNHAPARSKCPIPYVRVTRGAVSHQQDLVLRPMRQRLTAWRRLACD